jgi:restriction endonuclease S subunit
MPEAATRNAGWTTVAFGDVVRLSPERSGNPESDGFERFVGLEHLEPGDLRVRRWGEIADGTTFTSVFRPGQVLFGKRRAYQRKVAIADFSGVCSGDIYVLEPKGTALLPELLPFICQTDAFFEHAVGTSAGSLSPRTNWTSLASFEFVLPPIEEQRRIAVALVACRAANNSLVLLHHQLIGVELAYLKLAFGTNYDEPPVGVPLFAVSQVADVRTGLAKGREADHSTTTRPYLRVANVKDGYLDLSEMKEIVVEREKIDRYALKGGDVLMTEGGDLDKLGRGTVWQCEVAGCLHQNHVFAVRVEDAKIDPWYLAAAARSPYGRSYFLRCAKRSSNLASVNKQQVSAFKIPLIKREAQSGWTRAYRDLRDRQAAAAARLDVARALMSRMLDPRERR